MSLSYQQFCLQQMKIPIWRCRLNEQTIEQPQYLIAAILNSQQQVVGFLHLAEPCVDQQQWQLVVAMMQAIQFTVNPLECITIPQHQQHQFLIVMGESALQAEEKRFDRVYRIVHPSAILQDASLKRTAWNVLKTI